jgi:Spy/CpxP family protein refolding chaperone
VKKNWLLYLVIFSLALNFGTIGTFAYVRYQDRQGPAARGEPPLPMRALWGELKLEPSQRQALRGLFPEHRRKVEALRDGLAQKRLELFDLIKADAAPWDAIQAKIKEISALQGSLEEEMTRFLLEFKKHLTPEQRAALLSRVETRLECGPGGREACGFGRRGGPGPRRGMGPHGPPPGPPPDVPPGPPPPEGLGPR